MSQDFFSQKSPSRERATESAATDFPADQPDREEKDASQTAQAASESLPASERRKQAIPFSISFSALLVLIYGLTSYQTGFESISNQAGQAGSFYPPLVFAGQWWRFISASLLHANPGHLLNNVCGILIFGSLLEPRLGARRLLLLYALSAGLGLGFSAVFLPQAATIGASTIDFGLMGAYFTGVLIQRYGQDRRLFSRELQSAIFFVMFFVGWNILEIGTINLWGHVGGLLAGVAFMLTNNAFKPRKACKD